MAIRQHVLLESRSAYASTSLTTSFSVPAWARAAVFYWRISAVAGNTPIADCKLQLIDATSGVAIDVDSGTFAQQTGASLQAMQVGIGLTADTTGNYRAVQGSLASQMAAVFTFDRTSGDETYTFTLSADFVG